LIGIDLIDIESVYLFEEGSEDVQILGDLEIAVCRSGE
jgi:hypothetical protein